MTKREVVRTALNHDNPPYTPWSFRFTKEAGDKLVKHYGHGDIQSAVENHIIELGSDIGFFEDLGKNRFRDVFGAVWDRTVDRDIGNIEGTILTEPSLEGYSFPDPLDHRFFDNIPPMLESYPDCFRLYCIGFSLYERAWSLRGMENLLMDFYDNPDFVRALFKKIADYNIAQIEKAMTYDIDAVYFGDDWGQQHGLIMGYGLWKEFMYPELRRMYGYVKEHGKYVFIHSCGDVDELFNDLLDAGLDCFNPFQPEVMDTDEIFSRYGSRLSFWGGLSTQKTLPFGSVEDVRNEARNLLEMGREGGYILSPAHSVESDVPLENMLMFIEEAQNQPHYKGDKS